MSRVSIARRFGKLSLMVALLSGLPMATQAFAQTTHVNEKRPVSTSVANECNGEQVPFDGFIHFVETTRVRPDGTVQFTASDRFNGQGNGQVTQLTYTVGGALNINAIFDPDGGPLMIRERMKVISQGPADNFFLTVLFKVNGNGQMSVVDFSTDCRG